LHNQPAAPHAIPDFSAWGIDGATAQFGMQLGQNAVAAGQNYVQRNVPLCSLFSFNLVLIIFSAHSLVDSYQSLISNTTSMSQILMSFANSVSSCFLGGINRGHVKCVVQRQASVNFSHRETISTHQTFTSPVRHPSYVIPLLAHSDISLAMAFVTYILVAALQSGLQSRFHPEIFGVVATKAIVVLILDFLFVKGGCYLLGIQGTNPIVDLLAYGGYKFVGCVVALANSSTKLTPFPSSVIATLLVGLVGSSPTLYSIAFIYTFLANAFFLVRALCTLHLCNSHTCPSSVHCALSYCPMSVPRQRLLERFLTHNVRGASPSSFSSLSCRYYSWVYWSVYNPQMACFDAFPYD